MSRPLRKLKVMLVDSGHDSTAAVSFCIARKVHAQAIARLVNSAYRGDSSKIGWTSEADLLGGQRTDEAEIAKLMRSIGSLILVGLKDSEIVASVHLQRASDHIKLGMLAIYPPLQRAGLGNAILRRAEEVVRQRWQAKKIEITVITLRKELIAYYERRGYKRTGVITAFPTEVNFGIPKVSGLVLETLEKIL